MSFENMGVRNRDFAGENGIIGTRFHKYQAEGSLQDLNYDTIPDRDGGTYLFNETALDADLEFPQQNGGEASQILPSQLSVANTEVFQKSTLPELSPMSYSLTANYPFPLEDSINNLPASTLSLRQPTMFGLSLQNEESKSNQGSKLSIHGSRPSIHGSRPSIHGSRPSIHGSRPSIHESRPSIYSSRTSSIQGGLGSRHGLYNSGTSESLLSGGRFDKEHSIPDDDSNSRDIFTNRFSSPNLVPSNSDSMEVPTRDSSPLSRPLLASSHPLGHGKRDFASLTCIVNPHTSLPPTPEPLDDRDSSLRDNSLLARTKSPTHKKPKRDLTSLTSVPIPEEEEKLKKETKAEESKEESPSTKKGRSKAMSRLEKLTSLDYIRQSFRIKKKKVSFQNVKTPETTPTPTKKGTKKQASPAPTTSSTTPNSNGSTAYPKPAPEKDVDVPQRRTSNASTDIFSPTEESFFRLQQQQQAAQNYMDHMIHMGYAAQLSQPNYFMPHPQYPYPQLSQQYFPPQLSQSYPGHAFSSPYHHVHPEPFRLGQRGAEGHRETAPTGRYQEVITPDFSDITSPDHERYRPPDTQSPQPSDMQGSEYSYDLRPQSPDSLDAKYREREVSPSNYNGTGPPDHYKHRPPTPEHGTYLPGGHHLGMHHPDVVMRSPGHYPYYNHAVDPFLLGSPARYGYGRGQEHDARYPPQPGRRSSGAGFSDGQPGSRRSSGAGFPDGQPGSRRVSGGSMPDGDLAQRRTSIGSIPERHPARTSGGEEPPPGHAYHYAHHNNSNSISVDEPLQNTHRKYSLQSDTSAAETDKKNHVSWSSEVKEYPPHDANTSPSPT